MTTEPFLPAEPALADLAEQVAPWRRTRAMAQERIPPSLWDQAVVLTTMRPWSQVTQCLRLSPTAVKKQCLARPGCRVAEATAPPSGFIEVTVAAAAAPSPTLIEGERPDEAR
jgi:hypothetical protein